MDDYQKGVFDKHKLVRIAMRLKFDFVSNPSVVVSL